MRKSCRLAPSSLENPVDVLPDSTHGIGSGCVLLMAILLISGSSTVVGFCDFVTVSPAVAAKIALGRYSSTSVVCCTHFEASFADDLKQFAAGRFFCCKTGGKALYGFVFLVVHLN